MRQVTWIVRAQTLVDTDDDDVARQEVAALFDNRPWGDTGKCVITLEQMETEKVEGVPPGVRVSQE